MCSILFTNKNLDDSQIERANKFIKLRGPDFTGVHRVSGTTFVHNLLSITGKFTPQPYKDDDIVTIYNGEIYNYLEFGQYESDGQCIIPLYKKFGIEAFTKLDGEFSIILLDFKANKLVYAVDVFNTKPLWIARNSNGEIGLATYKSALVSLGFFNCVQVKPNRIVELDITKHYTEVTSIPHYVFSLEQYKTDYNGWYTAFSNSISKRTTGIREKLFVGLSSGYDSGAIVCELLKQHIPFNVYTVGNSENSKVMAERAATLEKSGIEIQLLQLDSFATKSRLTKNVEKYTYDIRNSDGSYEEHTELHDDAGAKGLDTICAKAIEAGHKIYLSGSGADEIISDYGWNGRRIFGHSNFGGKFPEDLRRIFPWQSFYGSTMRAYLDKEEYVAGSHGIETRYPFLDKYLVQEFLWLIPSLKNSTYKAPIAKYLDINGFAYANEKRGFNP